MSFPRIVLWADQYFNPSGVGVYTRNLIKHLQLIECDFNFTVVYPGQVRSAVIPVYKGSTEVKYIADKRVLYPIWNLIPIPRLEMFIGDFDLIHILSGTVRIPTRWPRVITVTDLASEFKAYGYPWRRRWFKQRLLVEAKHRGDFFITISEASRNDLVRFLGIPRERIDVTLLGVDTECFYPLSDQEVLQSVRKRYGLPDRFYLFVGVLSPRKNVTLLLKAYDCLNKRLKGAPGLVIVGPPLGWKENRIYKEWRAMEYRDKVKFVGFVNQADLHTIYSAATALVYPSLYEGFGLPVLEAMACGTPVICSSASALPEVAGNAALYVSGHSVNEMAEAMERIVVDTHLRDTLRMAGFQRIGGFSWTRCAQATAEVYKRLLEHV
ncbi:MAG: glycosyltransferase family 1 protein [Candidatus Methanomethyliaceae archaeon]